MLQRLLIRGQSICRCRCCLLEYSPLPIDLPRVTSAFHCHVHCRIALITTIILLLAALMDLITLFLFCRATTSTVSPCKPRCQAMYPQRAATYPHLIPHPLCLCAASVLIIKTHRTLCSLAMPCYHQQHFWHWSTSCAGAEGHSDLGYEKVSLQP